MTVPRRCLLVLALVLPIISACGDDDAGQQPTPSPGTSSDINRDSTPTETSTSPPTPVPPSPSPARPSATATTVDSTSDSPGEFMVLLSIDFAGGEDDPAWLRQIPPLTVMASGIVIMPPASEPADPPLIPEPSVFQLSQDGLQFLMDEAERAGLLAEDRRYALPALAAPTVVFRLWDRAEPPSSYKPYVTIVPGLLDPASDSLVPGDEVSPRGQLRDFFALATDLQAHLPPEDIRPAVLPSSITKGQQYQWVIQSAAETLLPDDAGPPRTASWSSLLPFDLVSWGDPYVFPGSRCGVFGPLQEYPGGTTLLGELRSASQHTRWEQQGFTFVLYLRPLLPTDQACEGPQEIACIPSAAVGAVLPAGELAYPTRASDVVVQFEERQLDAGEPRWRTWHVIYGDGSMLQPAMIPARAPGPLLHPWQRSELSSSGVAAIVGLAAKLGLLAGDQTWDSTALRPYDTDSMSRLTIQADGRTNHIVLSESGCLLTMTDAELDVRAAVDQFRRDTLRLTLPAPSFPAWFPPDGMVLQDAPYLTTHLEVVAWPSESQDGYLTQVWPLPAPLDQAGVVWPGTNARCLVVDGPDLAIALPVVESALATDRWRSGTGRFALEVRPLLPHEVGCEWVAG